MECATCGGWIHAKCEGVDAEKYQILSYLPNNIDFVCKKCHNDESTLPPWKQAVLGQITSGVSSVITKLSKIVPSANNKPTVNIPTTNANSDPPPRKEQLEHAKRALCFEEEEKE